MKRWSRAALLSSCATAVGGLACGEPSSEPEVDAMESSESGTSADSSTTAVEFPAGTCLELVDDPDDPAYAPHPVDSFWACRYQCGLDPYNDTGGDSVLLARRTFDELEPGQPDGCYELRLALYQCFDALTCEGVVLFLEAGNAMQDGPCTAAYYALEPRIPECGI